MAGVFSFQVFFQVLVNNKLLPAVKMSCFVKMFRDVESQRSTWMRGVVACWVSTAT